MIKKLALVLVLVVALLTSCTSKPAENKKNESSAIQNSQEASSEVVQSESTSENAEDISDENGNDSSEASMNEEEAEKNPSNETSENADYVTLFPSVIGKTVEEVDEMLGVKGELMNPEVSQVSYVWTITDDKAIDAAITADGKIRTAGLKATDEDMFNSNVVFAEDLDTLNDIDPLYYEDVKKKCGGVDGVPTILLEDKVSAYHWVGEEYSLSITLGGDGKVTSIVGRVR